MTENFSNYKKINQIFPTNFSDICSRELNILLIFQKIFLNFSKILSLFTYNILKIFCELCTNFTLKIFRIFYAKIL